MQWPTNAVPGLARTFHRRLAVLKIQVGARGQGELPRINHKARRHTATQPVKIAPRTTPKGFAGRKEHRGKQLRHAWAVRWRTIACPPKGADCAVAIPLSCTRRRARLSALKRRGPRRRTYLAIRIGLCVLDHMRAEVGDRRVHNSASCAPNHTETPDRGGGGVLLSKGGGKVQETRSKTERAGLAGAAQGTAPLPHSMHGYMAAASSALLPVLFVRTLWCTFQSCLICACAPNVCT